MSPRKIDNRVLTVEPRINYMINEADWLAVRNGCMPSRMDHIDRRVFIRNGRDIGQYVHIDRLAPQQLLMPSMTKIMETMTAPELVP